MLCFLDAGCLKTVHSPPAEPLLHPKRTAQPLDHIFTSSPISTSFRKPIFNVKTPSNSSQHLETSNHSENKENQQISSPQIKTEATCLKQGAPDSSSEIKVEPNNLEPSTVTTPPDCESEPPSAANPDEDEDEEDGDQTVFFTPELFDCESNEGNPQKETQTKSPPRMKSPVLLSEELLEHAQAQGQASAFDGQGAISVSEESTELSQGQKEGEEGEPVDNQSRQTDNWLHRLSRSRQKAPSTPTGNWQRGNKRCCKPSRMYWMQIVQTTCSVHIMVAKEFPSNTSRGSISEHITVQCKTPYSVHTSFIHCFTVYVAEFPQVCKYVTAASDNCAHSLPCSQQRSDQISFLCSVTAHLINAIKACSQLKTQH